MVLQSVQAQKSATPWPTWLLRYIASQDQGAYHDLVWSVGALRLRAILVTTRPPLYMICWSST
jgi:hypothetical protein